MNELNDKYVDNQLNLNEEQNQIHEQVFNSFYNALSKKENHIDRLDDESPIKSEQIEIRECLVGENEIRLKQRQNSEIEIIFHKDAIISKENCGICLGELTETVYLNCDHNFCSSCLVEYISNKINIYEVDSIICPQNLCLKIFAYKDIVKLLSEYKSSSKQICKKYLLKLRERLIFTSDAYVVCPIASCESYSIYSEKKSNFVKCKENEHIFCVKCFKLKRDHDQDDNCFKMNYHKGDLIVYCKLCGFIDLNNNSVQFICPICELKYCFMCKRYGPSLSNHFKLLTPCYELENIDKEHIYYKYVFCRYIRFLFILLFLILFKTISFMFCSLIFFYNFNEKFYMNISEKSNFLRISNNDSFFILYECCILSFDNFFSSFRKNRLLSN